MHSQEIDTKEYCPVVELFGQPIAVVEKICYVNDTGGIGGSADNIFTSITNGWTSLGIHVCILIHVCLWEQMVDYIPHACIILMYTSETWPVKENDKIKTREK